MHLKKFKMSAVAFSVLGLASIAPTPFITQAHAMDDEHLCGYLYKSATQTIFVGVEISTVLVTGPPKIHITEEQRTSRCKTAASDAAGLKALYPSTYVWGEARATCATISYYLFPNNNAAATNVCNSMEKASPYKIEYTVSTGQTVATKIIR